MTWQELEKLCTRPYHWTIPGSYTPPSPVLATETVKLVALSELLSHRRCVVRRDPCVPIEDQFGCQASMCHLDVFTDVRIIYATLWRTGAKPHTRSTNKVLVRKREREREGKRERQETRGGKRYGVQEKSRVDRSPATMRREGDALTWKTKHMSAALERQRAFFI